MSTTFRLTLAALLVSVCTAALSAQDALGPVRDLYASAAYEDALTALGRMPAEPPASQFEIDRYRVLCLMALGRAAEADGVIESMVTADPLYQPSAAEASPRVRAAFTAVRQRLLPALARSLYIEAKTAYDRKAYPEAMETLEKTVLIIDAIDAAPRAELADLRVLASGFLDLSRAAVAPPPAPPVPVTTKPQVTAPPAAPALPDHTPLVVLKQDLPPMPFSITALGNGEYRGVVELVIDDHGNVTSARMLQSVHALYDPMLLQAARGWKYEPPRIAGKPSGSIKRVEIVLKPGRSE